MSMGSTLTLPIAVSDFSFYESFKSFVGRRGYRATFLPEVAADQGWDQEMTLRYLVKKAGYQGKLEDVIDRIKCERYQSSKVTLDYKEYLETKQQL